MQNQQLQYLLETVAICWPVPQLKQRAKLACASHDSGGFQPPRPRVEAAALKGCQWRLAIIQL